MPRTKKQPAQNFDFNYFLLLISSVVLLGITAVALSTPKFNLQQKVLSQVEDSIELIDLKPILKEGVITPQVSAKGVYILDISSGDILFTKNETTPVLPASTTKISTALVAMNHYQPEEVLEVVSLRGVSGSVMGLKVGEKITALDLFHGLLISSANDAAYVLADNHPGGRAAFLEAMNGLVLTHNLKNTHFTNPVGFDEYLHFSTASDLATLATTAMRSPLFAQIVSKERYEASSVDGKIKHKLSTTNLLLGNVPGVVGIKTGHTATSGESLITLVERDDKRILFAVIGSQDRFGETKTLINWIFENYTWQVAETAT